MCLVKKMKKIVYIVVITIILIICVLGILGIVNLRKNNNSENTINTNEIANNEMEKNNAIIIGIEKNQTKEPTQERNSKTTNAAMSTQDIYNLNREIGTLNIPKTGLTTSIYSNVTVDKMEEMPCFLYTTTGLNQKGVTLFVGHNRMNGKMFSDNKKLNEGDEFYFKDYNGTELKYIISKKFITVDTDVSYLNLETEKPIIVLSCCTDENNENRLILIGTAE